MGLSKKNYIAIAKIIDAEHLPGFRPEARHKVDSLLDSLVSALARYFESDNPSFDTTRFVVACNARRTYDDKWTPNAVKRTN